jgi:hypothetical protein
MPLSEAWSERGEKGLIGKKKSRIFVTLQINLRRALEKATACVFREAYFSKGHSVVVLLVLGSIFIPRVPFLGGNQFFLQVDTFRKSGSATREGTGG